MGKQEQKLKEQETQSFCPFQPQFHSLQLERLQQLGLISGLHINPLVPGVGISWTQSINFSKFFFFFFLTFPLCLSRKLGSVCGRGGQFGQQIVSSEPSSSDKGKGAQTALVYCSWRPAGVPVFQPHTTPFCLWVLENKTLTLITLSGSNEIKQTWESRTGEVTLPYLMGAPSGPVS